MEIKVTHVKLKPLLPGGKLKIRPDRVLKSLQREVLKQVRSKILQETFSDRAKQALSRGMKVKLGAKSITVVATHPAFLPLLMGMRSRQMTWLTKARRPIPIVTDTGELIFRSATAKSMKDGKWIHPGHKPTTVLEKAREASRKIVKERVAQDLRRQLRRALQGASR